MAPDLDDLAQRQMLGTCDPKSTNLEQPVRGDGYALTKIGKYWRADVWTDNDHSAQPWVGDITPSRVLAATDSLIAYYDERRGKRPECAIIRERIEPGYSRAIALRDAMIAAYGPEA